MTSCSEPFKVTTVWNKEGGFQPSQHSQRHVIMILALGAWFAITTSQWDEVMWLWFPIKQSQLENHKEVGNCFCFHWFILPACTPWYLPTAHTPSLLNLQVKYHFSRHPHSVICIHITFSVFFIFYFSLTSLAFSISLPPAMRKISSNFINASVS